MRALNFLYDMIYDMMWCQFRSWAEKKRLCCKIKKSIASLCLCLQRPGISAKIGLRGNDAPTDSVEVRGSLIIAMPFARRLPWIRLRRRPADANRTRQYTWADTRRFVWLLWCPRGRFVYATREGDHVAIEQKLVWQNAEFTPWIILRDGPKNGATDSWP